MTDTQFMLPPLPHQPDAALLTDALVLAAQVAREAGALLQQRFTQTHDIEFKGRTDIVTEADKAAESHIVRALTRAFPTHHVVGEEGGGQGAPPATAPYRWYVDPLDGTTNYANRIPHYSVSIAMATPQGRPLVGAVFDPSRDELFTCARGRGAALNHKPLRVSAEQHLEGAVLVTGFPYDKHLSADNNAARFLRFLTRVRGLRRFGSAALDLAWVAAGRFDGYWEHKLNPWDLLAGALLVIEAGGMITDFDGQADSDATYSGGTLVASNGLLHAAMLRTLHE